MNRFLLALILPVMVARLYYPTNNLTTNLSGRMADTVVLVNTCLITENVQRLVRFYSDILQVTPKETGREFAEFQTGVGVLAIFSAAAQEKYIPGAAKPADNRSAILEFRVEHVDREYERIKPFVKNWVRPPATQPWGTRSIYFRDPDGNLIDFYEIVQSQ